MSKIFTILLIFSLFHHHDINADTIYKKIKTNGNIEYSDQPSLEAIKVMLPPANIQISIPPVALAPVPSEPSSLVVAHIHIVSPKNNESIRSNAGEFTIVVQKKQPNNQPYFIQLFINGKPYLKPLKGTVFKVKNIDRGIVKIKAQLQSNFGNILAVSQETVVYMHKASVIHKN